MAHVEVRPEATMFTSAHAAFTPLDEAGVVMLLDVDTTRPLTISVSFRPNLRLMWPAGLITGFLGCSRKGIPTPGDREKGFQ